MKGIRLQDASCAPRATLIEPFTALIVQLTDHTTRTYSEWLLYKPRCVLCRGL